MKNFLIAIILIIWAVWSAVTMINILRNDDRNAYFNVCNEITNTGSASFTALNNEIHSSTPIVNGSKYYVNSNFAINEITMSGWTTRFDWTKGSWWTGKCYLKNNSGIEIDISDAIYLTALVLEKLPKKENKIVKINSDSGGVLDNYTSKLSAQENIERMARSYINKLTPDEICQLSFSSIWSKGAAYSKKFNGCIYNDAEPYSMVNFNGAKEKAMMYYEKKLIEEEKKNLFWTSSITN